MPGLGVSATARLTTLAGSSWCFLDSLPGLIKLLKVQPHNILNQRIQLAFVTHHFCDVDHLILLQVKQELL